MDALMRRSLHFNLLFKLLAFFLLALIPIIFVSFLMNQSGTRSIRSEITGSLLSKAHFYMDSLEREVARIQQLEQRYITDATIDQLSISSQYMTPNDVRTASLAIQSKLQFFQASSMFVTDVGLYLPKAERMIADNDFDYAVGDDAYELLHKVSVTADSPILRWNDQLVMASRYPTLPDPGSLPNYWLAVSLSRERIAASLAQMTSENGGFSLLTDQQEGWLVASDERLRQRYAEALKLIPSEGTLSWQGTLSVEGSRYFVVSERSTALNSTLVAFVPESSLLKSLSYYRLLFWVLTAVAFIAVVLFAYGMYRQIHQPMQRLVRAFRQLEKGQFHVSLAHRRSDEFGYLYLQFNRMVEQLRQLVHDVYEQTIRSQQFELKRLQAQINPHFLYNAFFQMEQMAQHEDYEHLRPFMRHLGTYFQYLTRNDEDDIPLEKEWRHARAYADIQAIRFGCAVSFSFHTPLDGRTQVPRLILQPVIENGFEHGLEDQGEEGRLEVEARAEQDHMLITVDDNGPDLTDEKLEELKQLLERPPERSETTALINVHRRLQLRFGADGGIRLARSRLGGLQVTIQIPYEEKE